jgi:hypothetical protein
MKVPIESIIFWAYLQKVIPDAFDNNGLMDTVHEDVFRLKKIDIYGHGASSINETPYLLSLEGLDIRYNPKIKHLPKLPNTLKTFWSNHKFDTSVQPVFFWDGSNFVMLDDGRILYGFSACGSLDEFKTWVSKREDADEFAPFITECEAYFLNIKNKTDEK